MKKIVLCAVVAAALISIAGCSSEQYTQRQRRHIVRGDTLHVMTTQDVMNLAKAGVGDSLIVSMIDASDSWFSLKPQEVIDLKNAGVSEKVLSAMIAAKNDEGNESESNGVSYYSYWYGGFYPYGWGYWPYRSVWISPRHYVHRSYGYWAPHRSGGSRRR